MAINGSQDNNKKIKIAILISGRGSNMKAIIEACEDQNFPAKVVLVLSNKDNAEGLEFAKTKQIPTAVIKHQDFKQNTDPRTAFDIAMDQEISKYGAELICLAGFMRLLSSYFVKKWQNRLINIHPSLLPDFKGANAVADALKAKANCSGCTVHYVVEEMDSGPIIEQARVKIKEDDNLEDLSNRILKFEHKIYPQAIKKICQNLINNDHS